MKKQIISLSVRKIRIFLSTVTVAGMLFATASCVDNTESESVSALRNAKAAELNANADLLKAQAVAENIRANAEKTLKDAEAKLKEAEAEVQKADAEIKLADAKLKEVSADLERTRIAKEVYELSIKEGAKAEEIAAKKAEFDAQIAKYKLEVARYEIDNDLQKAYVELQKISVDKALYELSIKEGAKAEEIAAKKAEFDAQIARLELEIARYELDNDLQKAILELQKITVDRALYEFSIDEAAEAEKIAAKKAEYEALIASYEATIARSKATIAEQERLKQASFMKMEQLLVDLEVQKIRNQTELAQAANDAQTALLRQVNELAIAKINADRDKQNVIRNLIYQYNQLLLDINSYDQQIASSELYLAQNQAYLAVAYFDKSIDSASYVRNFEKDTADWNAQIEGYKAQIDAKTQAIDFWNSFKVEDLEKTIAAELDTLNNVLRPGLTAASEAVTESNEYLNLQESGEDDILGTEDDILGPYYAYERFKDSLRYFYRTSYSYSHDGEKYNFDYYTYADNYYYARYSYPLHTDNYNFSFNINADTKTKLVEAQTIALVIAKDIEYLKLDSARDAKLLADTFVYYSTLGSKYIAAKTALDNAAKSWTDSYNGYTASPQTVTEALFKRADSTYCDKYAVLYGGTADGWQTRPDGTNYKGFNYAGKVYGVYGWMSLNEEYYSLDSYVRTLKNYIDRDYIPTITSLTRTLASVNNLIGLLNSDKLATYQAAYDAAKDDYAAKRKEYDDVYAQIEEKRTIISQLGSIALGYGKVINWETYLVEEVPGYNVPDYIHTTTIDNIKSYIGYLESEIAYLETNITYVEDNIAYAERELEMVALLGDFHYSLGTNTAYINSLKSNIEYYTRQLVILKGEKEIRESDAAALKVTIENAFE